MPARQFSRAHAARPLILRLLRHWSRGLCTLIASAKHLHLELDLEIGRYVT